MEQCMKLQTEINSHINRMDMRIREWNRELKLPPNLLNSPVQGPLNPDCILSEDDFSPQTLAESTGTTQDRQALRQQKI